MAKKFGTTWWGEQWLNSLTHIDYGNRLPRGARYARNGSVRSIDIKNGVITARVAGSRPTPYKETITVPQFDKAKSAQFIDRILSEPLVLADLMQRKLDPLALQIAKQCGLQVFPTSWKDLGMKCSCPDWAVPCKHLAAVIYKVSEEIDNNPFLVFQLHGLDLLAELKKRGMLTDEAAKSLVPDSMTDLVRLSSDAGSAEWATPNADYSKLPGIGAELVELLADNPPFSIDGNFKKMYVKQLGVVGKLASKALASSFDRDDKIEPFNLGTDISFSVDKSWTTEAVLTHPDKSVEKIPFPEFVQRLGDVATRSYLTSQPWVEMMHKMWLLAATLLEKKDIVPHIVSVDNGYRVVWQPASLNPEVNRIAQQVTECVPPIVAFKKQVLGNSGEWLLWNMLNVMVAMAAENRQAYGDPLFDFFFLGGVQRFDGIGQGGIAGGIKVWTDKFFMLRKGCSFSIFVEECDGGFSVGLNISPSEASDLVGSVPFAEFMSASAYKSQQLDVMGKIASLIDYLPQLRNYVMSRGEKAMMFDGQTFVPFLFKTLPLMRLLGVGVALPKSLRNLVSPKVSVRIDSKGKTDSRSFVRIDELLDFDWEIALGSTFVSVDEFHRLMLRAGELVKFKGQYIYATPEELEKISKQLAKGEKLTSSEMLAIALSESYNDAPVALTEACRRLLEKFRNLSPTDLPQGLQAELRPYQLRGYEWMMHNLSLGFGSIIADDMGLGKTLQVIAVLLSLKESCRFDKRKALIVVPTGLLSNWQKECTRFAPSLDVSIYHGAARNISSFKADIMLTSYGVMRSDVAKLKKIKWELVVIDEAQNIKNTATAQTKAVNSIAATSRIAMSGTPVENRLSEYWSIMNFVNKGLLGSLKQFNELYGKPIQVEGSQEAADRFKAVTTPFMLRRLKSDKSIISDLPDKIERDEYASLTKEQGALYEQTLNEAMREIEGEEGADHASLFRREGMVLQMIMALKQICNHPAQFLKTHQADAELSGKATMLIDLVESIVENGEKVLIFTQFKEMGDLIVKMLEKVDISSMFYHGGTTLKKRNEMVERFQNQRSAQVFVLSLKAAGTGLNLTAATNVIHFDLWWNPAVEAQATDRAYRIGQHRNVQVYRFITKGTFEEKINAMIQSKKQLAELTVGTGEKWLASMSDAELRSIFTLEK